MLYVEDQNPFLNLKAKKITKIFKINFIYTHCILSTPSGLFQPCFQIQNYIHAKILKLGIITSFLVVK